jgi:hypothetical protein
VCGQKLKHAVVLFVTVSLKISYPQSVQGSALAQKWQADNGLSIQLINAESIWVSGPETVTKMLLMKLLQSNKIGFLAAAFSRPKLLTSKELL